jgi:hypothetical protein
VSQWFEWEYQPGASWGYDKGFISDWGEPGFGSPEEAATEGFPDHFVKVASVQYHPDGNHAVVELLTNEEPRLYPWTSICVRDSSGRWHEAHGSGG